MRTRKGLAVVLILSAVVLASAPAEAGGRFNIRVFGSWLTSGGNQINEPDPITQQACLLPGNCATMDVVDGSGGGLSVEFRVTKHRVGIELGALASEMDIGLEFIQSSMISPVFTSTSVPLQSDFTPIFLGVNYHVLKPESKVDFYVGALYADVGYSTETVALGSQEVLFDFEDDSGWGFNMAFDVYLSKRWYIGGGLRYIAASSNFSVTDVASDTELFRGTLDFDPYIFSFGGGVRF
ncbi:MAG: OmpW family outer membrane protein [Acidobacteriota bacterium]|nr:OmpW family outer membrane protein [Acidobacteriota bacterium]